MLSCSSVLEHLCRCINEYLFKKFILRPLHLSCPLFFRKIICFITPLYIKTHSPSVCLLQTFRYQRRVLPMPVACRPVNSADWRPPVEREESVMPLWLLVGRFPSFLSAFFLPVFSLWKTSSRINTDDMVSNSWPRRPRWHWRDEAGAQGKGGLGVSA